MNFQMNETVESPDADLVSRVLETCLRAQWHEVAREGSTIVLRGLGPSHTVNRNDRAVFAVRAAEGGKTAIEADVTYQASALVGASAPQNELVQRKLAGVIELVRMDLDLARRRAAQAGQRELKPWIVNRAPVAGLGGPERSGSGIQSAHVPANGSLPAEVTGPAIGHGAEQQSVAPVAISGTTAQATDEIKLALAPLKTLDTRNAGAVSEAAVAAKPGVSAPTEKTDKAVAEPKTQPVAASEFAKVAARLAAAGASAGTSTAAAATSTGPARDAVVPVARVTSRASAPAPLFGEPGLVHRGDEHGYTEERRASAGKIFGVLLVVFVLVGAAQVGWEYRAPVKQHVANMRTSWGAKLTAAEGHSMERAIAPSASGAPAKTTQAATQPDPAELARAVQAAKLAESDPKAWLANWAGALAGQDAAAQASYYADPVDKYFLRRSVTRADVLADKEASLAKRSGSWTLTLDDVVVAQQTDTAARILMVKHIVTANEAGERREERLPTQIRLKKIDGQWRIVSEQTLG